MDISVSLSYLLGLLVLFLVARLLLIPLRTVGRLLINGIIGGLLLAIFNLVGGYWGLYLAINPVTAMVAGLLGFPGVILMAAVRFFMVK